MSSTGSPTSALVFLCVGSAWSCPGSDKGSGLYDAGALLDGAAGEDASDGRSDEPDGGPASEPDAGLIGEEEARLLCERYVACVAVTTPPDLADVLEAYGPDGSCWESTDDVVALCGEACRTGLAQGRASHPDVPECLECETDVHCAGELRCSPAGRCVECTSDDDCGAGLECRRGGCVPESERPSEVDLLVVMDDSATMPEEQTAFVSAFPLLLQEIVDDDALESLHIGVISTDMGSAGYPDGGCADPIDGDDGVLTTAPSPVLAGCAPVYPTFLTWEEGVDEEMLVADFACTATLGSTGCGFEQPLNALERALVGHAAGVNAGFLRAESLLTIAIVTEEDDCSVRLDDPEAIRLFDGTADLGFLGLRCFTQPQLLTTVDDTVDALLSLRPDRPEDLLVAAVVGIPPSAECNLVDMTAEDYDCLLAHPAMQERLDDSPEGGSMRLVPSCEDGLLGTAYPPRRIVGVLRALHENGADALVDSICGADLQPAAQRIGALIASHL